MTIFKKTFLGLFFGATAYAAFSIGVFVLPLVTTSVDPNLAKPQCPGGKDWDLPGSSCHNGMIADYATPAVPLPTLAPDAAPGKPKKGGH
jgi:hypothetical protein